MLGRASKAELLTPGLQEPAPEQQAPPPSALNFHDLFKAGFTRAAENEKLEVLDLVTVRRSGTRVLRAGESPMVRGTAMLFDEKSGIVYLKGTVPYFKVYPGAYIPRAIEFIREEEKRTPPNWLENLSRCQS